MSVIVAKAFGHYVAGMASAVIRLLTLIAFVTMPLGMSGAPALAAPVDQAAVMDDSMATAGHCGTQQDQDKAPASDKMDCTAACTALPAIGAAEPAAVAKPRAPRTIALVTPSAGFVLEIATPPPRQV